MMLALLSSLLADIKNKKDIPTSVIVTQLKIVASSLGREEIVKWCCLELDGYMSSNPAKTKEDGVPEYRQIPGQYIDMYGNELGVDRELQRIGVHLGILYQRISELEELVAVDSPFLSVRDYDRFRTLKETIGIELQDFRLATAGIRGVLSSIRGKATEFALQLSHLESTPNNDIDIILKCFEGIRLSSLPLSKRRKGKNLLLLEDEYDLQDLYQSILTPWFSKIDKEEWTPKYAGRNKRMDFLLSEKKIAVETKYIRDAKHADKVADEIIADIEYYAKHDSVETLVAAVYDPNYNIKSRISFEENLTGPRTIHEKTINIICIIRPKQ